MESEHTSWPACTLPAWDGITFRLGTLATETIACSRVLVPIRTSLRPTSLLIPKAEATLPRRRSASTRQVVPCCAIAIARFTATVVLPSPGKEETTRTTWGGLPGRESMTDV